VNERNLALIYSRKSVVHDLAAEISNERQEEACIQEARRHGWAWEIYRDVDVSGRTEDRPEWRRLKAQLYRKEVAAVVVESLSRANRSVRDFFNFLGEVDEYGVALISVKERIDTSTAMGRAFVGFIAILNQLEADLASERMAMTIEFRQMAGRHWGLTPFGCSRDGRHNLIPTEEGIWTAPSGEWIVGSETSPPLAWGGEWYGYHAGLRRLYELYATGEHSYHSATVEMNVGGWPFRTRWGLPRRWTEDDTRRALQAWLLYRGDLPLGRQKDRDEEGEVVEGAHGPILPVELCDRVGAMLEERGRAFFGRRPHRTYVLSDVLYCHACGARLYGNWQKGVRRYAHYRKGDCPATIGRVACETIDEQVLGQLRTLRMPVAWDVPEPPPPEPEEDGEGRRIEIARDKLIRKLEVLKEMRIEGELGREEYYRRKEATLEALAELPAVPQRQTGIDWRAVLARLEAMGELLAESSPAFQKQAINALFRRIEVDVERGEVVRVEPRAWCKGFF